MFPMRHLLLSLASGSVFYSAAAPALGLGDIHIHSYLNQPLSAEIELLEVADLTDQDVLIRLASAEDFNRAGVERFLFLNDLRFSPMLANGRSSIRVTSNRPVKEPYLNFIVEVARPGGRLLREYTLLIDPPGSSAFSLPEPPLAVAERPRAALIRESVEMPVAQQGLSYQVRSGDSLWSIAGRLTVPGVSREALMADILALNPQAFVAADPARLRLVKLQLPDTLAVGNDTEQAAPVVAAQAPAAVESSVSAPDVAPVSQAEVLEQQAHHEAVTQQNLELQQSLQALQAQMAVLQEQVQAKDEQLVEIQRQLSEQRAPFSHASAEPLMLEAGPQTQIAEKAQGLSWTWWPIGALGAAALIFALWRRRQSTEPVTAVTDQVREPEPLKPAPVVSRALSPVRVVPEPVAAAPAPDALEGANIYMAYGRFADAAQALRKASEAEPQRVELRLRLLEAYGELNALEDFSALEQQLRADGAGMQVDPIRARYSAHLKPIPAVSTLLVDGSAELVQEDFQLNLDALSLDADWSLAAPFEPEQPARLKAVEAQWQPDMNFKPTLHALPEVTELPGQADVFAEHLEMHFELDESFNLNDDVEQLASSREHLQQLNQALAYIEQGNLSSACDVLNDVLTHGDGQERDRARELLKEIA